MLEATCQSKKANNVLFSSLDKASEWLECFELPKQHSSQIAGYDIETVFVTPEGSLDLQYPRDQLRRSVT